MKEIALEEIKKITFDILVNVAEFCEKNDIRYYLSYGTLLGAIRHKGFIPWDDDIDIIMPRPDYIKFNQLYPMQNTCSYYVLSSIMINPKHQYTFAKVFDTRTDKIEDGLIYKEDSIRGIDIDIFTLDGVPEDIDKCLQFKNRQSKLFWTFQLSRVPFKKSKSGNTIIKYLVLAICHTIGATRFIKCINKQAMKYDFDTSEFIGSSTEYYDENKERFKKNEFIEPIKVEFEGKQFNAPSNYAEYLTIIFGDYMQLPPKEEQVTHHRYKAFWK